MELGPYIAKGFPGDLDSAIANVAVRGIDREQTLSMVRLCSETETELYHGSYSAQSIRYQPGSRPVLEAIADGFPRDSQRETALAAMKWVASTVRHPHLIGPTPPDRAMSEEALIESGRGWCNEQARVFIALCQVREIPARLCFVNHANTVCGHAATEVLLDGRWAFFDVTFNVTVSLSDGRLAEARVLSGPHRRLAHLAHLAHLAYRPALERYYADMHAFVAETPGGWSKRNRPAIERGGDLLDTVGICNYLITGVNVVQQDQ